MLEITIPPTEGWDEINSVFTTVTKEQTLILEHSLISISLWEAKWEKPFLMNESITDEESLDYIKCMTINKNVNPEIYDNLTHENLKEIFDYIHAPMTATTFSNLEQRSFSREIITNELIYCWMVSLGIPVEFEKWHINRLLTLIRVCNVKNSPEKKMSKKDVTRMYSELNTSRRKKYNSKG